MSNLNSTKTGIEISTIVRDSTDIKLEDDTRMSKDSSRPDLTQLSSQSAVADASFKVGECFTLITNEPNPTWDNDIDTVGLAE